LRTEAVVSEAAEEAPTREVTQTDMMNQKLLTSFLSRLNSKAVAPEFRKLLEQPIDSDDSWSDDEEDASEPVVRIPLAAVQHAPVEFRIVESSAGIRPSPLHASRVPVDVSAASTGEDIARLIKLCEETQRNPQHSDDDE
jgi:hypothetical protein